ncbi:MAG: division/cell wall cluster transcriptional repressor MraZ [Rhodospirillaceae bacterium]|nr:division/cell wall cluster transcriptional repressor MraZ [Rhodospirillaceae bacterium]
MALLVGRHLNKVDTKGRVSVPKPFRDALGAGGGFVGVFVYPFFKYPALEGSGEAFMQRLALSLENNLDLFSDEQEDLASITLESTHQLAFDPEGRVVLPEALSAHANITTQALFVGRGSRFQIWSPELYERHRGGALERAREQGATLQLAPVTPSNPRSGD